jgi:TrmH family RNA methyltransferase
MNMIVTSVKNQIIKEMTKLHQKKYRDLGHRFLVEGYHLYEEAKASGRIEHVFTTDETIKGDHVTYVNDIVLQKLADTKHPQGVVTVCSKTTGTKPTSKVLILQAVQDPGNVGTLLRSALAFGFHTIVLDRSCDIYNDKVLRSTQGAIFHLNIIEANTTDFMKEYTAYQYLGTAMKGTTLEDIHPSKNIALILGNEGAGVDKDTLSLCHDIITIPMQGTESLNVAVAGSIMMYHMR